MVMDYCLLLDYLWIGYCSALTAPNELIDGVLGNLLPHLDQCSMEALGWGERGDLGPAAPAQNLMICSRISC